MNEATLARANDLFVVLKELKATKAALESGRVGVRFTLDDRNDYWIPDEEKRTFVDAALRLVESHLLKYQAEFDAL